MEHTDPVFRVFAISEIASTILDRDLLDAATLRSAACVCRVFKESALDALWSHVFGVQPLICILPPGVLKEKNGTHKQIRALSGDERINLLAITRRVKRLAILFCDSSLVSIRLWINLLLVSNGQPVLPALKELSLFGAPADILFGLLLLAGSDITKVSAHRIPPDDFPLALELFIPFHSKVLRGRMDLSILHVSFTDVDYWSDDEEEVYDRYDLHMQYSQLRHLLYPIIQHCHNLVDVRVSPSPLTIHWLSRLPHLETLDLDIYERETFKGALTRDASFAPFPSLKVLSLIVHTSLYETKQLLKRARCFPQKTLRIEIVCSYRSGEVASLLRVILDPQISAGLRKVVFVCDDVSRLEGHCFRFRTLSPLLALHLLEDVEVDIERAVEVTNADIRTIISSWPLIHTLSLGSTKYVSDASHLMVDLEGICALSQCAHLERLSLYFNATTGLVSSQSRNSKLRYLDVGQSPIESGSDVARTLKYSFPELKAVDWMDDVDSDSEGSSLPLEKQRTEEWMIVDNLLGSISD